MSVYRYMKSMVNSIFEVHLIVESGAVRLNQLRISH